MADFNVSGRMKVKTLRNSFKKAFGSTLRVYNGVRFASDDASVASIAKEKIPTGTEVGFHGRTKCGSFEKQMMDKFGIKVQVANPDDSALVSDSVSLTQSGKA